MHDVPVLRAIKHVVSQLAEAGSVVAHEPTPSAGRRVDKSAIATARSAAGPRDIDATVILPVLHRPRPLALGVDLVAPHRLDHARDRGEIQFLWTFSDRS